MLSTCSTLHMSVLLTGQIVAKLHQALFLNGKLPVAIPLMSNAAGNTCTHSDPYVAGPP